MPRRKGELLDLLRKQEGPSKTVARKNRPKQLPKEPQASRSKPPRGAGVSRLKLRLPKLSLRLPKLKLKPPRLRMPAVPALRLRGTWVAAGAFGLLGLALILWLGSRFGEGDLDASTGEALSTTGVPRLGWEAQTPAAGPAYGILAITYNYGPSNPSQLEHAKKVASLLHAEGFPEVKLFQKPREKPEFLEVYVGRHADRAALLPLLDELRQFRFPTTGRKDFSSATIRLIPESD